MCHSCRVRDERFYPSEALAQRTQFDAFQYLFCVLEGTRFKRDHPPKPTLLPLSKFMLRMRNEAGIVNLLNAGMLGKEIRHKAAIFIMGLHPYCERFRSS